MIYYSRNIRSRLDIRRALFVLICLLVFDFVRRGKTDYVFVLLFFALALSIFVVSDLIIENDQFYIKNYYFFGLIPKSWTIYKKDLLGIISFDVEVGAMPGRTGDDSFIRKEVKMYSIQFRTESGKIKKLIESLSNEEYNLLLEFSKGNAN